jgi:type IV secretory pathway ATPase VirB11/archaellum biosynthesis ATPase
MAAASITPEVTYNLRIATIEDIPDIRLLIEALVRTLHISTSVQITAALKSVCGADTTLILDKNYFVILRHRKP